MAIDCLCAGILFADCGCVPISRMPIAGELVKTEGVHLTVGGCAANAGLDLAKLGLTVGVSGCVGNDPFGRFLTDSIADGGADTSGIHQSTDHGTACSLIINVDGEDRRFISTPGASVDFSPAHIPTEWLTETKVLYLGGYLMMPALENNAMRDLFAAARAAGVKTVLDVVLMGGDHYWDALELLLPEADYFLPNDDESKLITGFDDPIDQANRFRDAGAHTVVITQGAEGTVLVSDSQKLRSGVYPTTVVGGTGSGDAFDAGFMAGLIAEEDMAGCLRWGSVLGASCVRSIGATESVFTRDEALAFMGENELKIEEI
jgi:sugar/nucleoside kinase (ribokinase family)